MEETVTIDRREYEKMLKRIEWLEYLEAAGVDNWEGYDIAKEMQEEDQE